MFNILVKAFVVILAKLLTEKFLSRIVVYILDEIAKSTANKLDDKLVLAVAETLGVEL